MIKTILIVLGILSLIVGVLFLGKCLLIYVLSKAKGVKTSFIRIVLEKICEMIGL